MLNKLSARQDYVAWQIEQHAKANNVQEALSQAVLDQVDSGIAHYEKTGLHVSFDEVRDWAKSVRLNRDAQLPSCHK